MRIYNWIVVYSLISLHSIFAEDFTFFAGGEYNPDIIKPEQIMGSPIGERPIRHSEAIQYLKQLSDNSPRVLFFKTGKTYEDRLLCYVVISSEENIKNIEKIKSDMAVFADPRKKSSVKVNDLPGVAWMMYSIHGDELSGTDAGIQLAYQLAAGTDERTIKILDDLVIGIDPMENPDGRERFLAQMQQWGTDIVNTDVQAIQHTGVWPYGRGNHYLFDLNRDWFILAHPESRARVKAINEWHPQLVVDAHEMGGYDTFLFHPPREPINQHITYKIRKWWDVFSADQSKAFDEFGWSYYTREWADDWFPGYGSSLPAYSGAVSILYEQAGTDGTIVKKPSDELSTFQGAVHRQFISSIANLTTAMENRINLLKDYWEARKQACNKKGAYYILPGDNPSRLRRAIDRLMMNNIEVYTIVQQMRIKNTQGYYDSKKSTITMPPGTVVIPLNQPMGNLVDAIFEFDPRMKTSVLQKEYEELQKGKGSHLYEVSAWSMLMAYDLEAYYVKSLPKSGSMKLVSELVETSGKLLNPDNAAAFLCKFNDDNSISTLLDIYNTGLKVRAAKEPFEINNKKYKRGTLLLRSNENPDNLTSILSGIADENHIEIEGVKSMRILKGPDLGGNDFRLLEMPRIALLSGPDLSANSVGALWYLLDQELKLRFSILNHNYVNRFDLRKYNVLILPDTWGNPDVYDNILGKQGIKKITSWIEDGGTLIAVGNAAAFVADSSSKLSQVKLKRQALKEFQLYEDALINETRWQKKVDSLSIWENTRIVNKISDKRDKLDLKILEEADKQGRLLQPRGSIFQINLDEEHWLNFGLNKNVPAVYYSSYAFLSKKPVQTVARFAEADQLRLSGLLWPEARERWANTAYLTRESKGKGQIILFADEPNFRSYFYGTTRLLINAMLLGPGMGASTVIEW